MSKKTKIINAIALILVIIIPPILPLIFPRFLDVLLGGVFTGNPLAIIFVFGGGGGVYIAIIIYMINRLK